MHIPFLEKSSGLKGLPRLISSDRFITDNVVMLAAGVAVNLLRYGYQLAMGIMLSPADYGLLMSLNSLLVIVGILTQTAGAVVTKTTATLKADNQWDMVCWFYRTSLKFNFFVGIGLFGILAAAGVFITRWLNLGSAKNISNSCYVFLP